MDLCIMDRACLAGGRRLLGRRFRCATLLDTSRSADLTGPFTMSNSQWTATQESGVPGSANLPIGALVAGCAGSCGRRRAALSPPPASLDRGALHALCVGIGLKTMHEGPHSIETQLAANRRLLWTLVVRDLRARYAGSGLGIFWSVIHPLIMLFLYIVVFSTLMKGSGPSVGGVVTSYAVFLLPALMSWNWLYESLQGASTSITGNASLIKKVVFPSAILPAVSMVAGAIPFAVTMAIFLVFACIVAGFSLVTLAWLPAVVALQVALMAGPAYLLAALNVLIRDTAQLLTAVLQFLFWGTPIVYAPDVLTRSFPWARYWFDLNPVAHLVGAYRDVIIAHRHPQVGSVAYILIVSVITYHFGRALFHRSRRHFPDEV